MPRELRWNPVLKEWVGVATHRQDRTFLPPAELCPLCPTRNPDAPTEIPSADFDVAVFQNRFSAFAEEGAPFATAGETLGRTVPARGVCEVVVYTPEHQGSLGGQRVEQIRKVVEVWADRYAVLGALPHIRYVFIFENRGEAMGVTLHHPHGQIYALPYVPPLATRELRSAREHYRKTSRCLFCDILERELSSGQRLVLVNETWAGFVPFYARWPYEVHLYPRRHAASLVELEEAERWGLAHALKTLLTKYDSLYGFPWPYVMAVHQRPTDSAYYPHYHLHIEFYPPHRTREKLKYLAGVELGTGTFLNDTRPEEKAEELRNAAPKGTGDEQQA